MRNSNNPSLVDVVHQFVEGRWLEIATTIYGSEEILKAAQNPGKSRANCPAHGGDSGSTFKFFNDVDQRGGCVCYKCGPFVGWNMLKFISGKDMKEVFWDVVNHFDLKNTGSTQPIAKPKKPQAKVVVQKPKQWALRNLRETFARCIPINSDEAFPAQRYFKNRGLPLDSIAVDVMFDPKHPYYDRELNRVTRYYPAVVSVLRDHDGTPISLHRIFIDKDGKKALGNQSKMMMPTAIEGAISNANCSIHVCDGTTDCVAVCEGIEDAVAVNAQTGFTTFATYSSFALDTFLPPVQTKKVVIYGDFNVDGYGQLHAAKGYRFLKSQGYECDIILPISKKLPFQLTEFSEEDKEFEENCEALHDNGYQVVSREMFGSFTSIDDRYKELDWNDLYNLRQSKSA